MSVPQVAKSSDMVAYSEGGSGGACEEYESCRGVHRRGDHHPPYHRLMAAHPATIKYGFLYFNYRRDYGFTIM